MNDDDFKSKYDFNLISSKATKSKSIKTTKTSKTNPQPEVLTKEISKIESSSSSLVELNINKKYNSIQKKSPHQILILKLKCYIKLFNLTYNNYYTKDFSILRSSIYYGTSMYFIGVGSIFYFFYFNPLKNSLLSIAFFSYIVYTYISWKKNIDQIIFDESLDSHGSYVLGNEIKETLNDIALYNPFSRFYI
jgi:hypothetical protein